MATVATVVMVGVVAAAVGAVAVVVLGAAVLVAVATVTTVVMEAVAMMAVERGRIEVWRAAVSMQTRFRTTRTTRKTVGQHGVIHCAPSALSLWTMSVSPCPATPMKTCYGNWIVATSSLISTGRNFLSLRRTRRTGRGRRRIRIRMMGYVGRGQVKVRGARKGKGRERGKTKGNGKGREQ